MELDGSFFTDMVDRLTFGVFLTDANKRVVYWNNAAEDLTGFRRDEAMGTEICGGLLKMIDPEGQSICESKCPIDAALDDGKSHEVEARLIDNDGMYTPIALHVDPVRDGNGDVTGVSGILRDNAHMAAARQRIEELETASLIDPLTKLGNRLYLEMNLLAKLNELRRYGWPFGIIFMDVDNFKTINDRYGHDTGDRMLVSVAQALQSQARPFDVVGRWGGDEFCAVIVQAGREQLEPIAERYRIVVEESSFQHGSDVVQGTVSVGAALAKPDDTVESLYRRVDQLMYQSKSDGRNCLTVDLGEC